VASCLDAEVVSAQVDAIGFAEERQVDVVVDHEQGAGVAGQLSQEPSQRKEVAPAQLLLAKLKNLCPAAEGGGGRCDQAIRVVVGGDDVEVGGEKAVLERVWRGPVNLPNVEKCQFVHPLRPLRGHLPGERGGLCPLGHFWPYCGVGVGLLSRAVDRTAGFRIPSGGTFQPVRGWFEWVSDSKSG
jgi:hypothetical protein